MEDLDGRLLLQGLVKFAGGLVIVAGLLFLCAGTLDYWQAWLFLGLLFIPMLVAGFVMLFRAPELFRKRLNAKEEQTQQRAVVALSGAMFIAAFALAGLGRRFGWPMLPGWATWAASAVFLAAYALYAEVMRENAYLSRTVEVQQGQRVVDTGLYGVVRHPMYMSVLLLFLSMPLILGSLPAFAVMLGTVPILSARIRNEEQVLEAGLEGYAEYKKKVRYRMVPHIW